MKINKLLFLLLSPLLFLPRLVHAHCPLCTGAVIAGAVGAKYMGINTSIVGVFVGAAGISLGIMTAKFLKKKYFPLQTTIIVLLSFLLTVVPTQATMPDTMFMPVHLFGSVGSIFNTVYFTNKILFGSIIGGIVTVAAYGLHLYIKKKNQKVLFPFQGIALTVLALIITSIIIQLTLV